MFIKMKDKNKEKKLNKYIITDKYKKIKILYKYITNLTISRLNDFQQIIR